jgi:hypothetical protein
MKVTDEILNKYIDGELSAAEINELKNYLSANPNELEKLKALKLVDNVLSEMEYEAAPHNFTEKFMNRLNVSYSSKSNKFYLGFIGVFLFGLSRLSFTDNSSDETAFERVMERIGEVIPAFSFSLSINSDTMMLIVSILVLVTLIAAYIIINSHKAFKDNLENLSH